MALHSTRDIWYIYCDPLGAAPGPSGMQSPQHKHHRRRATSLGVVRSSLRHRAGALCPTLRMQPRLVFVGEPVLQPECSTEWCRQGLCAALLQVLRVLLVMRWDDI